MTDTDADDDGATRVVLSRVARLRQRAMALVDQAMELYEHTRATIPPVDIAATAVERDNRIGGFLLAGAIAFRFFVYLLPLYLLVLLAAGAALSFDPDSPAELGESAGLSQYLASTIGDAAQTSKDSLWILAPVTLWALLTAGRSAHKVLAVSHANAWGVSPPRGLKPHKVSAMIFVFALAMLAGIVTFRNLHTGYWAPVGFGGAAIYYFFLWLAASRMLPRSPEAPTAALIPGAVLVAAGSQGLYLFNALYLNQKIQSSSEAYGALGVAASLLLWLYLMGRLMVAAPVLNATMWERSRAEE
ncbi:MAG TPA: YhjD/YihY/BrkB family envelope integrity protein, partial [Actinomycetota bacterium]